MDFVCINVVATHVQLQIGASIVLESSKSLTGRKKQMNKKPLSCSLPGTSKMKKNKDKKDCCVIFFVSFHFRKEHACGLLLWQVHLMGGNQLRDTRFLS